MRFQLDPTQLHENGKAAVFTPFVSGGSGGYWNVGTGARWKFTTRATFARVRVYANQTNDPRTMNLNLLCYRVNGQDYWANAVAPYTTGNTTAQASSGYADYEMLLPGGVGAKTFELFVPVIGVIVLNQAPKGVWPFEIEFNADAVYIAPTTTGAHRLIYGDSITTGPNAAVASLQGFAGIMKRGTSDPLFPATSIATVPRWKGVYSAGTLYAVNDMVSYSGSTWRKLTTAAAGTTPAVGTDWEIRGFIGRVTEVAYGFRRLFDDCSNGTAQTAFASFIAGLATGAPELLMMIGTNDWFNGWANVGQFQAAYTGFLNALSATSVATMPIRCVSPLLTTVREGANGAGNTMDDYRAAVSASVTAAMTAHPTMNITFVDGKAILNANDLDDGLHPTTAGHAKLRAALL